MNRFSSPCQAGAVPSQNARLSAISRATDELSRCVSERGRVEPANEMGLLIGECDWLAELERLLYES